MNKISMVVAMVIVLILSLVTVDFITAAKGGVKGPPPDRPGDNETGSTPQCSDNIDNDGDGYVDFDGHCKNKNFCSDPDPDCASPDDPIEGVCIATVETCDGIDNDCDLLVDEDEVCQSIDYYCDADTDSYTSDTISGSCSSYQCVPAACSEQSGLDCDDASSNINPGIIENCDANGVDNDCDGIIDECSCFNAVFDAGLETDVDCGGTCAATCSNGQSCSVDADCSSNTCDQGVCAEQTGCEELYPGLNDPAADRVNVVFVGLNYNQFDSFKEDMLQAVDYHGNVSAAGPGLMELAVYNESKDKFNFWYVDQIFASQGDPTSSCTQCQNAASNNYCTGLANKYVANFCETSFRSCAYFGGSSFNSAVKSDWPFTFDHEFQHQFPTLADEYTEGSSDRPRFPNCAPDLATAQSWWGDLAGQTGHDGLTIGYYDGCSYVLGNYRSVSSSIMRARSNYKFGMQSERHVQSELDSFTGAPSAPQNAMVVTLQGDPSTITSYNIVAIEPASFSSNIKQDKHKPHSLLIKAGNEIFSQNFEIVQELIIEDFAEDGTIHSELVQVPQEEVTVIVPLDQASFNAQTQSIDFPEQSNVPFLVSITE